MRELQRIRELVSDEVEIWLGGARASELAPIDGIDIIRELDELEQRVQLLDSKSKS